MDNITFFTNTLNENKDGHLAVGWGSKESQEIRFRIFSSLMERGKSVLDVGCGLGDFSKFVKKSDYVGYDILPAMVKAAKKKYPNLKFTNKFPKRKFDYTIASGIFNLNTDDWYENTTETLARMWSITEIGMGVNFLSSLVDKRNPISNYTDPFFMMGVLSVFSDKFILLHGYKKNDFTIFLYK